MVSRFIPFLSCSGLLLVLASAVLDAGGWAVITVKDLPDHVVVGTPVTLTYAVRQHGRDLLGGLDGRLEMRADGRLLRTAAAATPETGYYSATFTVPTPGNWTVDIFSGFAGASGAISSIKIRAIEPDALVPALTATERGQRLFTAKGCVTCHVHSAAHGQSISSGAPELTSKRYQPEYLKQLLANPPAPRQTGGLAMPDLKLRDAEIASLVAFLNAR
jgi:cytochrome c551/c552